MYKAILQLNGNGHGRYQLGMRTETRLEVIIYGDDPDTIRREASRLLDETIGYPFDDKSEVFKEDFRRLPVVLKGKLGDQVHSHSLELSYDPYEFPPTASWAISKHSGSEIVIVLQ